MCKIAGMRGPTLWKSALWRPIPSSLIRWLLLNVHQCNSLPRSSSFLIYAHCIGSFLEIKSVEGSEVSGWIDSSVHSSSDPLICLHSRTILTSFRTTNSSILWLLLSWCQQKYNHCASLEVRLPVFYFSAYSHCLSICPVSCDFKKEVCKNWSFASESCHSSTTVWNADVKTLNLPFPLSTIVYTSLVMEDYTCKAIVYN
jgi:hypothetical protein